MTQYIDKDVVVTEIEKLQLCTMDEHMNFYSAEAQGEYNALSKLEYFLNTLEVKDVDLEKESELIANEIMIEVQANKYHTNIYNTERNDFNHSHLWLAARKGIGLGINAQKRE